MPFDAVITPHMGDGDCGVLRERLKKTSDPAKGKGLQRLIIAIERDGWRPVHNLMPPSFLDDPDPATLKAMGLAP